MLFQTLKPYYTAYFIFTFLIFLFCRLIFYIFYKYEISSVFRLFSFWGYYFIIFCVSNTPTLVYYCLMHFQLMFSLTYFYKMYHCFCLIVIGLYFLILFAFFIINEYFHHNLCKYFLINTYRIKYSNCYAFIKISILPFLNSAVHLFLFQK